MFRVKIFKGYREVENEINDFIYDKDVIDIKLFGSRNGYGDPVFVYMIIYMEVAKYVEEQ